MKLLMLILFFPFSFEGKTEGNCSIRHWKNAAVWKAWKLAGTYFTGTGWQTGSLCHVP